LTLTNKLTVPTGGTGAVTLNSGGVLYGNGTAAIGALPVLGNGGLIIGDGAGAPSTGTLTGTANQVTVTPGAGTITLSLPQDIHTAATPTFASLTLTNMLTVSNGGTGNTSYINNQLLQINAGGNAFESSGKTVPLGDIVGTSDNQTLTGKTMGAGSEWRGAVVGIAYGGTNNDNNMPSYANNQLLRVNSAGTAFESSGKTVPSGDIVGTTDGQTLTNKTMSTGSTWQGGAVGASYGGTGRASPTSGQVLVGNGTGAVISQTGEDTTLSIMPSGGFQFWGDNSCNITFTNGILTADGCS
jgi:hypothetical protein